MTNLEEQEREQAYKELEERMVDKLLRNTELPGARKVMRCDICWVMRGLLEENILKLGDDK